MWKKLFVLMMILSSQIGGATDQETWGIRHQFDDKVLHARPSVGINSAQMVNQSVVLTGLGAYAVFDTGGEVRFTRDGFNAVVEAVPSSDRLLLAFGAEKWQITDIYSGEIRFSDSEAIGIMAAAFSDDESRIALGLMRGGVVLLNLLDRSRHLLFETTKFVDFVAFSPDDTKIVANDYDDAQKYLQYRVFDVRTHEELYPPLGRPGEGMAHHDFRPLFTDDGHLVTANGTYLDVHDLTSGKRVQTINGHRGRVVAVAQKPKSSVLVYGSEQGELRAWDLREGIQPSPSEGYTDEKPIRSIHFNCDGTRMLTTRDDGDTTIVIWDTSSSQPWDWKPVATLKGDKPISEASFGPHCGGVMTNRGTFWVKK
ncbi:MAG: WD40 repeat domain-containing protein [Bdellovibrionales bacterium]